MRRELSQGLDRRNATTTVLQRARLADSLSGMWEAADVQWRRRPRAIEDLALPVWFDDVGPVAVAGLTSWKDAWQADVFAVSSTVNEDDGWAATMEVTAEHSRDALKVLVGQDDLLMADLALQSGIVMTDELSGTAWMDADHRPPVEQVEGFVIVNHVALAHRPHPMILRNVKRSNNGYNSARCTTQHSILPLSTRPRAYC
ncbi:MAG: hypothetical protein ACYDB2_04300 [Acidimicrobiales bacterium]